jgi:Flp pilus assembly pilin Flp
VNLGVGSRKSPDALQKASDHAMDTLHRFITRAVRDERGQDLIEYALLSTFIALVAIAGATALGTSLNNWYGSAATNVNTDAGSAS